MSTNRPLYSSFTRAGRNCIGAPRDDVGLNAQGVPRVTDPGPYGEGAYVTTTADTLKLTPAAAIAPVTFVYDIDMGASAKFSMSSATPGATIYYTNDLTDPTDASTLYTAPIADDSEPVESPNNFYYKAVAYVGGVPSAVSTAAGIDYDSAISLVGGGILSRNDVHTCPGIISDALLEGILMHRLWQVNGSIDFASKPLLAGFYLPVGIVTGNIFLSNSGGVGGGLIDFANLQSVTVIDLSSSTFTSLDLTMLYSGTVLAANATALDTVLLGSFRIGSVTLTGCALTEPTVDDIFNGIATVVNEPDFDVSAINLSGGTSAAPTAASAVARTALGNAGVVITTN